MLSSADAVPPGFALTPGHLMLAAQIPSEWERDEKSMADARLAVRKVVWRALMEEQLQNLSAGHLPTEASKPDSESHTNTARPLRKIGRLNDSAYASWDSFVTAVRGKLGPIDTDLICASRAHSESQVAVFHVLRCIVGPVIESFILLDRLAWMREELEVRLSNYNSLAHAYMGAVELAIPN